MRQLRYVEGLLCIGGRRMILMKHLYSFLLVVFFIISCEAFAISADNASKEDAKTYRLYNDIQLLSNIKYVYGKSQLMVKTVYPYLMGYAENFAVDHFNDLVKEKLQQGIDIFKLKVEYARLAQQALPAKKRKNHLYIDYAASFGTFNQHHLLSIRLTFQGNIAGESHPYHYHQVINYDLDEDEQFALNDLFDPDLDFLNALSEHARDVLSKRLSNTYMIASGTEPTPQNFRNWNINVAGLLFTFEEDQVAPYVNGAQTVLIPFSVLKKYLSKNSPLAGCIKRAKSCARHPLQTGGFIDEAFNSSRGLFNPILSHG